MRAVGINYAEMLIRLGRYPQMPDLPWVPGVEVAGATADGRRVLGLLETSGGGYAERAAVDERWVFDLPAGAASRRAPSFLMAYLTAWIPLTRQALVGVGSRVLVHAAAGGVGTAAVQVARPRGRGRRDGRIGGEARVAALARRGPGGHVRTARRDRAGGRRLRPGRRTALRRLDPARAAARRRGGDRLRRRCLAHARPGVARRPQRRCAGLLPGPADAAGPGLVRDAALDLLRLWSAGSVQPVVGSRLPARAGVRGAPADRGAAVDRQGRARPVRAIVTGGASGLGAAIVSRLRAEGLEVEVLDLTTGFDVADSGAWDEVGPVDVACLNAGVLGGASDPALIDLDAYRRALAVNVDGVVLGVRRLAQVMPAGGRIVATASLAGLTAMPDDPVYAASKHAVIGFVRSVAPGLARRDISINAVCPGIADTPMITTGARGVRGRRLPPRAGRGRRERGVAGARVRPHRPRMGGSARQGADRLPLPERPRRPHARGRDRPRLPHSPHEQEGLLERRRAARGRPLLPGGRVRRPRLPLGPDADRSPHGDARRRGRRVSRRSAASTTSPPCSELRGSRSTT